MPCASVPFSHAEAEAGTVEELAGRSLEVDRSPLMEAGRHIGAVLTLAPAKLRRAGFSTRVSTMPALARTVHSSPSIAGPFPKRCGGALDTTLLPSIRKGGELAHIRQVLAK